jgi:hypothetical protein
LVIDVGLMVAVNRRDHPILRSQPSAEMLDVDSFSFRKVFVLDLRLPDQLNDCVLPSAEYLDRFAEEFIDIKVGRARGHA